MGAGHTTEKEAALGAVEEVMKDALSSLCKYKLVYCLLNMLKLYGFTGYYSYDSFLKKASSTLMLIKYFDLHKI